MIHCFHVQKMYLLKVLFFLRLNILLLSYITTGVRQFFQIHFFTQKPYVLGQNNANFLFCIINIICVNLSHLFYYYCHHLQHLRLQVKECIEVVIQIYCLIEESYNFQKLSLAMCILFSQYYYCLYPYYLLILLLFIQYFCYQHLGDYQYQLD